MYLHDEGTARTRLCHHGTGERCPAGSPMRQIYFKLEAPAFPSGVRRAMMRALESVLRAVLTHADMSR